MSELFNAPKSKESTQSVYWDRTNYRSIDDQLIALHKSSTVYVGNLNFATTEQMIYWTFARAGPVKRIIMGINGETSTPCGFCFVEFFDRQSALDALSFLSGSICDSNIIRCELDAGFIPGREVGRGPRGGQIRHEKKRFSHQGNRNNEGGDDRDYKRKNHGRGEDREYDRNDQGRDQRVRR
jgi:nuclear cap-binding protein subunit 2